MTAEATLPYETLAFLIERELELVGLRRFDELPAVWEARAELIRSLPTTPPEEAGPVLERCRQLHKRVEIELMRVRDMLLLELAQVRTAQRAAQGYAPARVRSSWLQLSA